MVTVFIKTAALTETTVRKLNSFIWLTNCHSVLFH